jgi:hypothetical protein
MASPMYRSPGSSSDDDCVGQFSRLFWQSLHLMHKLSTMGYTNQVPWPKVKELWNLNLKQTKGMRGWDWGLQFLAHLT